MDLLDIIDARKARDDGMARAVDHADRDAPGWSNEAYSFLISYARTHDQFIAEQFVAYAEHSGLIVPPTGKAYGAVFKRGAKAGIIERIGFGVSTKRHASPTPLWQSRIYQGSAA